MFLRFTSICVLLLVVAMPTFAIERAAHFDKSDSLTFKVEYYVPKNRDVDVTEVASQAFEETEPMFSLGPNVPLVWLRITVQSQLMQPSRFYLLDKLAYLATAKILYKALNQGYELLPKMKVSGHAATYEFTLEGLSTQVFYVKNTTTSLQAFNVSIQTLDNAFEEIASGNAFSYFICYFLLAFAFYNLALYFLSRRKEHLYYALYIINSAVGLMYLYGILYADFGFTGPGSQYFSITSLLVPFFITLFIQSVFDTKLQHRRLHLLLNSVVAASAIVALIASFFSLPIALGFNDYVYFWSFLLIFYSVFYFYKLKHPLVGLFFISYILYFVGILGTLLGLTSHLLALSFYSFYSSGIGILIEGLLFSYLVYYRIKLLEDEVALQRNSLIIQNKKIQLGNMISAITHQWKQPLAAIGSTVSLLQYRLDEQIELSSDSLVEPLAKVTDKVRFMSETIDDFSTFFQADGKSKRVEIDVVIQRALVMINDDILSLNVSVETDFTFDQPINTQQNEVLHIVLNLLQNALDAFKTSSNNDKKIAIRGGNALKKWHFEIEDNAGGIDVEVLPHIFNEYVTSKNEKSGSGIGLYLTRFIVEKHLDGEIAAFNTDNGSLFKVVLRDLGHE